MFRFLWTATRYFMLGLIVGYLTAPRRGDESRRLIISYIGAMLGELVGMPSPSEETQEQGIRPMRRAQP